MKEKVWVVSSKGLVGSDMVKYLQKKKYPFVASSKQEADVTDYQSLLDFYQKHRPSHIINCSAHVRVDLAENEERDLAYNVNVKGVINLAKLAKSKRAKLIHIGTDYVFDGGKESDYLETDPTFPVNHYGQTKLEGEQAMFEICSSAVCVRTASLYGAAKPGLVSSIIEALENQEEVRGVIDQISTPTYVPHLVEAIWAVRNQKGIFHFVNKGYASRFDLIEEVRDYGLTRNKEIKCTRLIGLNSKEFHRAAVRPIRSVLATTKIEPYLDRPIPTWQAALREYLREIGWINHESI